MKKLMLTGALILGSVLSVGAMAQPQMSPEEAAAAAIKQRQSVFQLLAFANGPLGQMARGADFDQEASIKGTERLIMLADMIPELFVTDTSGAGVDSRAADTIWANQDDFAAMAADLAAGATAALEILQTQGAAGVRPAIGQIGPKCGACHDRFRLD